MRKWVNIHIEHDEKTGKGVGGVINADDIKGIYQRSEIGDFALPSTGSLIRQDIAMTYVRNLHGFRFTENYSGKHLVITTDNNIEFIDDVDYSSPENYIFTLIPDGNPNLRAYSVVSKYDVKGEGKINIVCGDDNRLKGQPIDTATKHPNKKVTYNVAR